jgi:hypothetical protein
MISGSCHHGMARIQVADGGTVSNMEGSFEYIFIKNSRGHPTKGGPPAWGLGEVLTTAHRYNVSSYEMFTLKASDMD